MARHDAAADDDIYTWVDSKIYIYIYVCVCVCVLCVCVCVCVLWIYGISILVGYLMPYYTNEPFFFKQFSLTGVHILTVKNVLFQAIQFTQTVPIQIVQFSISTVFVHT